MTNWHWGNNDDVELEASYDFDSDINLDFYSDINADSEIDFDLDIDLCVDIYGNSATFAIDRQAFGNDTSTDLNLVVLASDDYSSVVAVGHAAVG